MSCNKLKCASCMGPFSHFLEENKKYSGKQDYWCFVDKVSYHGRHRYIENINATWNTTEQKDLLLTMTQIFTVMVEPEWLYSVIGCTHTAAHKTLQCFTVAGSYLIISFIPPSHFFLCLAFINTYLDLSIWAKSGKVIRLRCPKIEVYFE